MRPTVLVLRPERAAAATGRRLDALGYAAIVAPVLVIEDLAAPVPDGPFDAVLATSANGVRKLRLRPAFGDLARLPLVAVGDRTAAAGREAGFSVVHVAEGDGRALAAEVRRLFPAPGRFLHAAGADRAFDVAAALERHGHRTEVVELYRASPVARLPDAAAAALARGAVAGALHHSRRIAETFLRLGDAAGLGAAVRRARHAALALRVAEPLRAAGCGFVTVAARPDEPSLFDALGGMIASGSQSAGSRSS